MIRFWLRSQPFHQLLYLATVGGIQVERVPTGTSLLRELAVLVYSENWQDWEAAGGRGRAARGRGGRRQGADGGRQGAGGRRRAEAAAGGGWRAAGGR